MEVNMKKAISIVKDVCKFILLPPLLVMVFFVGLFLPLRGLG